ncbi:MAG: AbrB/MazE/SpoVT family DNA-binding domain-containing protein [Streptococcaceae bacterium]|jgi:AbrB family looped-hinge helix DNA binding protein|nr:AbrB/MazE/SpoVT family DNA-binding domain-containing protein [Streptococcaceae bacterium]
MQVISAKVSSQGQVVVPAPIRKKLNISGGSEIQFLLSDNGKVTVEKLPDALDWEKILEGIPFEQVDIDENGHYDPEKSPNFHEWMEEKY